MRPEVFIAVLLMLAGAGARGETQQAGQCPAPGMPSEEDISGQIVDDQGRPMPGVEVWSVQPLRRDGIFPKAVSGPDGRFSVPTPYSGGYLITCPAGFRSARVDIGDLAAGPLRISVRRLAKIAGRVTDPDGGPVAGARVSAILSGTVFYWVCQHGAPPPPPCPSATESFPKSVTTDQDGRFEIDSIDPGEYEVTAEAGELFQQEPSRLRATEGQAVEAEIVIGEGPLLSGRVLSADGAPVAEAPVKLVEFRAPEGERFWWTVTDPQGRYRFRGVKAGKRQVRAAVEGMGKARRNVEIRNGETRVDLRLAPDREIRGRVVDADAARVEGADLFVEGDYPSGFSGFSGFPDAWTDQDGAFSLRLENGVEEIEIRKSGFATAHWKVPQESGESFEIPLEIRLVPAGEIVGQMRRAGRP